MVSTSFRKEYVLCKALAYTGFPNGECLICVKDDYRKGQAAKHQARISQMKNETQTNLNFDFKC